MFRHSTLIAGLTLVALIMPGVASVPEPELSPCTQHPAATTVLTWTTERHGQFTWDGAVAAAAAYDGEGFTDWRLPTVAEAEDAMLDGTFGQTNVINGTINQYTNRSQGQWNTVVRATTDADGYPIPSTVGTKKVLRTSWLFCKFVRP